MWSFFLKNYRFTYVMMLATLLIGIFSVIALPKEANPEIKVPVGNVTTILPGASSEDVEMLVTNEIEEKISNLDELDSYTSISAEGISVVNVTFDASSDIDDRIRALKDAVDNALPELPDEVDTPSVRQINFDDQPVLVVSLASDIHPRELNKVAKQVEDKLELIKDVSEVEIIGVEDREVQIILNESRLQLYDLALNEVLNAITQQNSTFPAGTIEYQGVRYPVKFEGDISEPIEILSLPVGSHNGQPVYVEDIADINDSFKKSESISRISVEGSKSLPAISLQIKKSVGGDILRMNDKINATIEEMQGPGGLLDNVTVLTGLDTSEYIREDLGRLSFSGMQTLIIVLILLIFILGMREAFIAALSIPMSFLIALIGLSYIGSSINFLSLFSLILALGILVDSGIVLTEGVHRKIISGLDPYKAAHETIEQFKWPIISGVMTTIAAMVPMLFASGVIGEFIKHIPITVSLVLLSALFVTLGFLPTVAARFLKADNGRVEKSWIGKSFNYIEEWYTKKLEALLSSRAKKVVFTMTLIVAFFISLSFPVIGLVKVVMFPSADNDFFYVEVELPTATTLEENSKFMRGIEEIFLEDKRIESFTTNIGVPLATDLLSTRIGATSNISHMIVNLYKERDFTSLEYIDEYQRTFKNEKYGNALISLRQADEGPPSGAPIAVKFKGDDLDELNRLSNKAKLMLKSIEGTENVKSSVQDREVNFEISVDRARAQQVGLTPTAVAQIIRAAVYGVEVTEIKRQAEDIDVLVKLNLNKTSNKAEDTTEVTIDALKSIEVRTPSGMIPLDAIVNIKAAPGQGSITHEDGVRTVQVTGYTRKGFNTQEITQLIQSKIDEFELGEGHTLTFGGETEDIQESFADMFRALFIGVFLIAAILVLQFNSFRQPIYVLCTVPLAVIGIIPGLALVQMPISFTGFVGIVALAGIVVNNAILLIDRVNENRKQGHPIYFSVVESAGARFRPIILTTITTVAGILPLALSDVTWGPLGFSIIFGLTFSTILTLFVVPMLYFSFEKE